MLTEPLGLSTDYLPAPIPQVGGLGWINSAQLTPPQHQLQGRNEGLQGGVNLRDALLERLRASFGNSY